MMRFEFDDGGRSAAGFRGRAGDCVTRAVADGEGNSNASLSTSEVVAIRVLARLGMPQVELADWFSTSTANISLIVNNLRRESESERRVSACVNACEGMDDPATEISEMRECVRLLGEEQNAAAERDLLRERERELVEALKGMIEMYVSNAHKHTEPDPNCAACYGLALLAKHGR